MPISTVLNGTECLVLKDAFRSSEWGARAGPNVLKAQILSMKTAHIQCLKLEGSDCPGLQNFGPGLVKV